MQVSTHHPQTILSHASRQQRTSPRASDEDPHPAPLCLLDVQDPSATRSPMTSCLSRVTASVNVEDIRVLSLGQLLSQHL